MKREWIVPLFVVAGLYDFLLGASFLFAWPAIYAHFGITPPNHAGYVQFGAAVIAIFGIGFWFVARAPERNRDIIKLGVLLKLAYTATVLTYWARHEIPMMWVPFAWIDLVFMVLFAVALRVLAAAAAVGRPA
ncbi:MAG: hypothetical protein ACHQ52_04390 [Candidatus Eisenbacteria bacterium]